MTSEEIPVIDFRHVVDGKFESGSCEWRELRNEMIHACETNGLFRVLYDQIPDVLYKDILSLAREIYELPVETRKEHKASKPFLGYNGNIQVVPLYESLVIDARPESLQAFVELIWPGGNRKAFEILESFYGQLGKMGWIIMQMIMDDLGVGNLLESLLKSINTYYTLAKYTPPLTNETAIGLIPHTDFHFFTIIFQDDIGGLEFETKDGAWISISPLPHSFIVLVGDSFKAWSNNKLESVKHRVVMNKDKERFSLSFCLTPKDGVLVEAPEELVDSVHPRVFKPFEYKDFLLADHTIKQPLYSYAGI